MRDPLLTPSCTVGVHVHCDERPPVRDDAPQMRLVNLLSLSRYGREETDSVTLRLRPNELGPYAVNTSTA